MGQGTPWFVFCEKSSSEGTPVLVGVPHTGIVGYEFAPSCLANSRFDTVSLVSNDGARLLSAVSIFAAA